MDRQARQAGVPRNAFSVDLEDWYHGIELAGARWDDCAPRLEIGLRRVLDLLERHGVHATFFALGWIARRHPALVREVADRGHELGSHGFSHEKVYDHSPTHFRRELRDTKDALQDLTGRPVTTHRSPFFSVTPRCLWAFDVLREEGYAIDCSISPVRTWRYGIPSCPDEIFTITNNGILEFPVSSLSIFGRRLAIGGAYFRLLPYWLTRRALRARRREGRRTMFYVHPWEYDASHPVVEMEWRAKLTHYARLHRTEPNTKSLLREFRFDTVTNVANAYVAETPCLRTVSLDFLQG